MQRRSIRLVGHNYAEPGWYFVTICTHDRIPLFGKITNGKMVLSRYGYIAKHEWHWVIRLRKNLHQDAFIVMPDHIHIIVHIVRRGMPLACPNNPPPSIMPQSNQDECPNNPPPSIMPQSNQDEAADASYDFQSIRNIHTSLTKHVHTPSTNNRNVSLTERMDERTFSAVGRMDEQTSFPVKRMDKQPSSASPIKRVHDRISVQARGMPEACPYERHFGLPDSQSLSMIVNQYKSTVTKHIYTLTMQRFKIWQRNYYERIIRNGDQLFMTREYIRRNPERWSLDH